MGKVWMKVAGVLLFLVFHGIYADQELKFVRMEKSDLGNYGHLYLIRSNNSKEYDMTFNLTLEAFLHLHLDICLCFLPSKSQVYDQERCGSFGSFCIKGDKENGLLIVSTSKSSDEEAGKKHAFNIGLGGDGKYYSILFTFSYNDHYNLGGKVKIQSKNLRFNLSEDIEITPFGFTNFLGFDQYKYAAIVPMFSFGNNYYTQNPDRISFYLVAQDSYESIPPGLEYRIKEYMNLKNSAPAEIAYRDGESRSSSHHNIETEETTTESAASAGLTALWIILGVIGGLILILVIVVCILRCYQGVWFCGFCCNRQRVTDDEPEQMLGPGEKSIKNKKTKSSDEKQKEPSVSTPAAQPQGENPPQPGPEEAKNEEQQPAAPGEAEPAPVDKPQLPPPPPKVAASGKKGLVSRDTKETTTGKTTKGKESKDTEDETDGTTAPTSAAPTTPGTVAGGEKVKDKVHVPDVLLMNTKEDDTQSEGKTSRRKNKVNKKNKEPAATKALTQDPQALETGVAKGTTKKMSVKNADGNMVYATGKARTETDLGDPTASKRKTATKGVSATQGGGTEIGTQATQGGGTTAVTGIGKTRTQARTGATQAATTAGTDATQGATTFAPTQAGTSMRTGAARTQTRLATGQTQNPTGADTAETQMPTGTRMGTTQAGTKTTQRYGTGTTQTGTRTTQGGTRTTQAGTRGPTTAATQAGTWGTTATTQARTGTTQGATGTTQGVTGTTQGGTHTTQGATRVTGETQIQTGHDEEHDVDPTQGQPGGGTRTGTTQKVTTTAAATARTRTRGTATTQAGTTQGRTGTTQGVTGTTQGQTGTTQLGTHTTQGATRYTGGE